MSNKVWDRWRRAGLARWEKDARKAKRKSLNSKRLIHKGKKP